MKKQEPKKGIFARLSDAERRNYQKALIDLRTTMQADLEAHVREVIAKARALRERDK